jgi:hypothetical protein
VICQSCHGCLEDCACPRIGFSVGAKYGPCVDGVKRITGVSFGWAFESFGESWRRPIWLPDGASFEFYYETAPDTGVLLATFFAPDTDEPRPPESLDAAFDPAGSGLACLPRFFVIVRNEAGNFLFKCWVCPIVCDASCSSGSSDSGSSGNPGSGGSGGSGGGGPSGSSGTSGSGGGNPPPPPPPPSSGSSSSASTATPAACVCSVLLNCVAYRYDNEIPTKCYVTFSASLVTSGDCDFSNSPLAGLWTYTIGIVTGNGNGATDVEIDCLPDGEITVTATFTPTGGGPVGLEGPCTASEVITSFIV